MSPIDSVKVFERSFFARPTLDVAADLLGAILCRRNDDGSVLRAEIVEIEAYTADDPSCHAFRGKTKRCEVMFGPPGFSYVYFIYGMYNCLNVVTEPDGTAGAILIRAINTEGGEGPGKLCKTLNITRDHNAVDLTDNTQEIWLERGEPLKTEQIAQSIRVGISQAQDRLWRFYVKDHPMLSVKNVKIHKPKSKAKSASRK